MTTQSMPISRSRKDYIESGVVLLLISVVSVLGVYFTHPVKLRTNATSTLLGIEFPNFQGVVMRQPRMTIVAFIAIVFFSTGFIFIGRTALPFFSRALAWGAVVVNGIALGAVGFSTGNGTTGGWFKFLLLTLCIIGGSTILAEGMIFYRRFFHDRSFRTLLIHKITFALVCGLLAGAMSGAYYHYAVKDGIFLDYGIANINPVPPAAGPPIPSQSVPTPLATIPGLRSVPAQPDTSAP